MSEMFTPDEIKEAMKEATYEGLVRLKDGCTIETGTSTCRHGRLNPLADILSLTLGDSWEGGQL